MEDTTLDESTAPLATLTIQDLATYRTNHKDLVFRARIAKSEVERIQDVLANGRITVDVIEGLDQLLADMPGLKFMLVSVKEQCVEQVSPVAKAQRLRSTKKSNLTSA